MRGAIGSVLAVAGAGIVVVGFALGSPARAVCDPGCDNDGDGACAQGCGGDDCDDADSNRYPGNIEVCDTSNHDEDCDLTTFGTTDVDGDGFIDDSCCNEDGATKICGNDCDDSWGGAHPYLPDPCDDVDNDCDRAVDEDFAIASYADVDGDGWGDNADAGSNLCPGKILLNLRSVRQGDCNDGDPSVHPGQLEQCNNLDDDCDGRVDEGITGMCAG